MHVTKMDPSQGLPGNEFRESFEARPRDPPDAVPLQQIQNRGNGKNLYRAPPFAEFKLAPAPGADNPENRVDTATFVRGQTHLMLRSKGPLTRPRDSKLNRNLSSSGSKPQVGQLNLQRRSSNLEEQVGQILAASTGSMLFAPWPETPRALVEVSGRLLRGLGNILGDNSNLVRYVDGFFAHRRGQIAAPAIRNDPPST